MERQKKKSLKRKARYLAKRLPMSNDWEKRVKIARGIKAETQICTKTEHLDLNSDLKA